MTLLGNVWCKFVSYGVTGGLPSNVTNTDQEIHYGIFLRGEHFVTSNGDLVEGCSSYPDYQYYDSKWITSKAFSIIVAIVGTFALLFGMWSTCLSPSENAWRIIGPIFILMCLFQGLTLLYLSSNACDGESMNQRIEEDIGITFDDNCSLSTGANMCISSTALWFVAGAVGCCISKYSAAPPDEAENDVEQEERVTEEKDAEGEAIPEQARDVEKEEKPQNEEAPGGVSSDTPESQDKA